MQLGTLTPPAPYNLQTTATLLSRYHGVLDIERDGDYLRALRVGDDAVLVRVRQMGEPDAPQLAVEMLEGEAHHADAAMAQIQWVLAVDLDVSDFNTYAQTEAPRLWEVAQPLAGVRHFRAQTVFEALTTVIIEQQISLYAALKAQRRFAEWGGSVVMHAGEPFYTFPTVERVAAASHDELHDVLKITHRRVDLIERIAAQVTSNELDLAGLRDVDAQTAYETLNAIKGVGHWTVAWTLVRGLGRYAYVGHNDVALRDAVAHYFYDTDERVSDKQAAETFARFGEYAGLAAFYTLMRWAIDRY